MDDGLDHWDIIAKSELTSDQRVLVGFIHWTNASIVASFLITLQWLGCWNLMTLYWPERLLVVRDWIYVVIGCIMLFICEKWIPLASIDEMKSDAWEEGVPATFQWKRKFKHYMHSHIHFVAFLFFWTGSYTLLDERLWPWSLWREIAYILIPAVILFFTQEFLSRESLYWICVRYFVPPKVPEIDLVGVEKNQRVILETS